MSAIIAVCGTHTAHVLTDAIRITSDGKGVVTKVDCQKQQILGKSLVVAGIGFTGVGVHFSQAAEARGAKTFDEVVAVAPELFAEERRGYDPRAAGLACIITIAGWSDKAGRLKQHAVFSLNADHATFSDCVSYAGGPPGSEDIARSFAETFNVKPNDFDAERDGLPLIKEFRRLSGQVGGFVLHNVVTSSGVRSQIIYRWHSDQIGRQIDIANL
jgi:hypothetical protein